MTETLATYHTRIGLREEELQAQIVQLLRMEGLLVFEFAPAGSRPRCPQCGTVVGRLAGGVEPGFPDLLVIIPRCLRHPVYRPGYIHIEVKVPGGRRSPAQARIHAELRGAGANVEVAESLEQLGQVLERHGHRMRTTL